MSLLPIQNQTGGKRIYRGLQRVDAHDTQEDWTSAELETVTTSRCPTTVITANGEVQTHEEATVYVKELDIFFTVKILEDTPAVLSLGKVCEDHGYSYERTNGQQPCLIKTVFRYNVIRKTNYQSWSRVHRRLLPRQARLVQHLQHRYRRKGQAQHLFQHQLNVSESADEQTRGNPLSNPTKNPKPNKDVDREQVRGDPSFSEILELLQKFRKNLVDERLPEYRDSHLSSSHEPSFEPQRRVVPGKHSIYIHFPKA